VHVLYNRAAIYKIMQKTIYCRYCRIEKEKNVEYDLRILKTKWTLNNLIDISYFYTKFRTDVDFNTDK